MTREARHVGLSPLPGFRLGQAGRLLRDDNQGRWVSS